MLNILIIEPNCSGHRAGYVYWIARDAVRRGHKIQVATCVFCLDHPLFIRLKEEAEDDVRFILLEEGPSSDISKSIFGLVAKEIRYHRLMRRFYTESARNDPPDVVLVPYLDYCSNVIAVLGAPFGNTPWLGIVMNQDFHFAKMGVKSRISRLSWVKYKLFKRLIGSRFLKAIFTLDETLVRFFLFRDNHQYDDLLYLPDPADSQRKGSRAESRCALGIDSSAAVILVYGAISERKGIHELLSAISSPGCDEHVQIFLAGRQSEGIRRLLSMAEFVPLIRSGRLHQIDRFISSEEECLVFTAADIVWLGYKDFYRTSGVLVQAGQARLPVIATCNGLIGNITKNHKLGVIADVSNRAEVQRAINLLVSSPNIRSEFGNNGKRQFSSHTVETFSNTILDIL